MKFFECPLGGRRAKDRLGVAHGSSEELGLLRVWQREGRGVIKLGGIWRVAVFLIAGLTPAGMSCAGQDSGATCGSRQSVDRDLTTCRPRIQAARQLRLPLDGRRKA
jgi:hypothetical protein